MCLAILKPKGVEIKKKYLQNGFDANEDGAGFAYVRDGQVIIQKGYFNFKDFYKAFKPFNSPKEIAIVHFRQATHGVCNQENCHPFMMVGNKFACIHNGILDIKCSDKDKSDTFHFATLVLDPMLREVEFTSPALKYLVETSIGGFNKIVVLNGDGKYVIFNEDKGTWEKGCWYSNCSYKWGGWRGTFSGGASNKGTCSRYHGETNEWTDEDYGYAYASTLKRERERKRVMELTDNEWREQCAEEMNEALATQAEQDAEENSKYSA
jgi:glutamine amidotransferase